MYLPHWKDDCARQFTFKSLHLNVTLKCDCMVFSIQDENTQVQLQLLTAIVKLFLKRPTDTQELVQQVLSLSTQVLYL